jgi:hypothetical protein
MSNGEAPSFERDIKPLFRERDRDSMMARFDLWSYDDVRANEDSIYQTIDEGIMPCDGPWPREDVERLRAWIDAGSPP